jgi:hypothetical protein
MIPGSYDIIMIIMASKDVGTISMIAIREKRRYVTVSHGGFYEFR